jgi:hypothetical protein
MAWLPQIFNKHPQQTNDFAAMILQNFMSTWRQMEFQWNQESGIWLTNCTKPVAVPNSTQISQPLSHCVSP